MNKTMIIKKIIGEPLEEYGFKYVRCEKKILWTFARKVDDIEQEVFIQQHNQVEEEYKLILWSSAKGNGGPHEIGHILPQYKMEYWKAETEEEFTKLMRFFADFLLDKGMIRLKEMLVEKEDPFENRETKLFFKLHRKELAKKYNDIYHILDIDTPEKQVAYMDEILYENRNVQVDADGKPRELLLGLAAILTKIYIGDSDIDAIHYDTYRIKIVLKERLYEVCPLFYVVAAWDYYSSGMGDLSQKIFYKKNIRGLEYLSSKK